MAILKSNYNHEFFESPSPESAYFLGFFWGDGYLYKNPKTGGSTVSIEILSKDMKKLLKYFIMACKWNEIKIYKKLSKNEFYRIYSGDRKFYDFLLSLGLGNKLGNYDLVLSKIPPNYHRYFYRGLLDADGSIGRYKSHCVINIASHYDQDWSSLTKFCNSLDITPKIIQTKAKRNKAIWRNSMFVVGSQCNFFSLLDELYKNADLDGIYLPRKYNKYLEIKRRVELGINGDVTNK